MGYHNRLDRAGADSRCIRAFALSAIALALGLPASTHAVSLDPGIEPHISYFLHEGSADEAVVSTVLRIAPATNDPLRMPAFEAEATFEAGKVPSDEGFGPKFRRAWIPITAGELALLGITATLPKSWTGWSPHFVRDGANHFKEAWSGPPIVDTDWWFHNYIGHPYGGSLYYNSVRSQGATVRESFFMSMILSTQWEYVFEAVAERPSVQDLVITPVVGSLLGETIHRTTAAMRRNGTSLLETVFITIFNPMSLLSSGH